ncbi:protein-disulfide reductase DsbD family protein [Myroides marinus]|uniref:protein-disulfide reductase DsbD family protein n=1 Tax=Myroides marinus TaxID=703342 RepID=UPI0025766F7B|nr:cytochrome c biogenesis protein CcdA [Myroides marinus]MDM1367944.1 thioredoxin family protein [Myroides marinus]MDM1377606.1 thioredoxin family protein [Myroides marinus]MDM1382517.1 thioredoxin family protein [Myroides marinus]MDM1384714.1 thioredoxin family protein [Myroides marinus]MDM1392090.1 thioredoxin family protein [Myroides marinus]
MRKLASLLLLLVSFVTVQAQVANPAKWQTKIEKKSDTEYTITWDGIIAEGWHMYSQYTPEGGPLPTEFLYNNQEGNYELVGKAKESETKTTFNDVFGVDETYYVGPVKLVQDIKLTNAATENIQVELAYQVCEEMCISQSNLFVYDLKTLTAKEVKNFEELNTTSVDTKSTEDTANNAVATDANNKQEKKGLFTIFFLAFLSGFAALLTPCVFPMIPMTVSFFTKQSKTRAKGIKNAIIYGLSIILIYVVLGTIVTAIFGADSLNALSTNVYFNIIFFVLLVVFATSFLGAFEIMLPNSWANKVDSQADRGGIVGILFMALALAIVSFSCTGPIVGTLLVEAASKGGIAPIVGMLGFSLALALPFMLFAMFPGWLNSMPRSGGWLNTVKVSLGFLELALAFKFLSNADLVLQAHWLEREVFLAIWIAIFGAWALYLLGKIKLPHDSPTESISVGRLFMALVVSIFTIYMIPGLWGAPLKIISGFPPPMTYSESPYGVGGKGGSADAVTIPDGAKLGAHDIIAFTDYEKGMAYAKSVNKPVLLDFTGFACVNCRKMEDYVWSEPAVLGVLKNDIVLISLYVDDKQELPESEQYISETTGKKVKTIGNKWSDFQMKNYHANAQPYYIVLDKDGNRLNEAVGYIPDAEEYKAWLESGINKVK